MTPTVSKDILNFLTELQKNNNRDWFAENKPEFKRIESKTKDFYNEIFKALNVHDEIDKLKVFRIYRDVRFSKDKRPYKNNFGGSFHRVKPRLRGGYYLQLEPNNKSFIAVGFWNPEKEDLLRIRKEFEIDDQEIRNLINNKTFKSVWGNFVGEELKTAPKGFNKAHPAIDLIRKKQFIFVKNFTDKEVLSEAFFNDVCISFKKIKPYFNYMSTILTTDLNGVSTIND